MKIIKKMDDLGRICVPKEIRRSLRWMGGDEIEIVLQEDGSVNLRKHEDNTIAILQDLRKRFDWREDSDIDNYFIDLIEAIKEKTEQ